MTEDILQLFVKANTFNTTNFDTQVLHLETPIIIILTQVQGG